VTRPCDACSASTEARPVHRRNETRLATAQAHRHQRRVVQGDRPVSGDVVREAESYDDARVDARVTTLELRVTHECMIRSPTVPVAGRDHSSQRVLPADTEKVA
jgi:hypothetical protein